MARPLLHFVAIGAALFALDRLWWAEAPGPEPLLIDQGRVREIAEVASARLGRPATPSELEAWIAAEVDDELLLRRARALGLDRDDPVVRRRLVQNMRFAGGDDASDDLTLYEEALALGMDRTDVVVRRRLIQRMRLRIESSVHAPEPDDAELRAYLDAHAERFTRPRWVRITQVYFSREHGAAASKAIARVRDEGLEPEAAATLGDPFLHPAHQPPQSEAELAKQFGSDFASAVIGLPEQKWAGPVASAYGHHLVYVHETAEPELPSLDAVRGQLRHAVLAERGSRALDAALRRMRSEVEVRVERPAEG